MSTKGASFSWLNRAGQRETILTRAQLIDFYCVRGANGEAPLGFRDTEDDEGDWSWTFEIYCGEAKP